MEVLLPWSKYITFWVNSVEKSLCFFSHHQCAHSPVCIFEHTRVVVADACACFLYPVFLYKWMPLKTKTFGEKEKEIIATVGADVWTTCWSDKLNASIQPAMAASPCFYCLTQWWIIYLLNSIGGQKIWFSCLQIHETSATEQLLLHVAKVTYQGIFSRFVWLVMPHFLQENMISPKWVSLKRLTKT